MSTILYPKLQFVHKPPAGEQGIVGRVWAGHRWCPVDSGLPAGQDHVVAVGLECGGEYANRHTAAARLSAR